MSEFTEVLEKVIHIATIHPSEHPDCELANCVVPVLPEEWPPPSQRVRELREFLNSLSPAHIYMLLVVMYIGRGDVRVEDCDSEYERMSSMFGPIVAAKDQLIEKAPLAEYLDVGKHILLKADIDLNQFPTFSVSE